MASQKFWVGQKVQFRQATVFCLSYYLLKHKMTKYSKIWKGHGLLVRLCTCGLYNVYAM